MPVAVTIRHVPDEVRNQLAARAAMKGWSLQEFLLQELIDLSGRPDREAVVAQLRSRLAGRKPVTVDAIVAARSADRR